jgi:hypothetical protein
MLSPSSLVQKLIALQDSPSYKAGSPDEASLVNRILLPILFKPGDNIGRFDTLIKTMFYCMRDDSYTYQFYIGYHSGKQEKYQSYEKADEHMLKPVSKNKIRKQLNRLFTRTLSIKDITSCFNQLVEANLLIPVDNMFLVNLPYISRAITQFRYLDVDTNNTKKQKNKTLENLVLLSSV